jgi:hypothetical protein
MRRHLQAQVVDKENLMGNEQRMFGNAGNPNPAGIGGDAWSQTGGIPPYRGSVIPNQTPGEVPLVGAATIARLEAELREVKRQYGELHDVIRAILGPTYSSGDLRDSISWDNYDPRSLPIDRWALLAAFLHRHPAPVE